MTTLTTRDVAARLRVSEVTVPRLARRHGIGSYVGGRAGWRFTEADVTALLEALRPAPEPMRRRRRAS